MNKDRLMKQGSTIFLKGVVLLIGIIVLAFCIFALPAAIHSEQTGYYRPILLGMYVPVIPFFFALFQALKLLSYIDENKAFSNVSVKSLKNIKYCGIIISVLYTVGMPYIYIAAERDDAPGVVLIGLVFTFAPLIIAVFAAVLEKTFQNAIEMKSENDLTV